MDVFSKEERTEVMKAVKSKGNKSTELALIRIFKQSQIIGWRRNFKLFGKPDFVFPKQRVVIFADGCFWHGHDCRNTRPVDNQGYWAEKIRRNKKRDNLVTTELIAKNWKVIRIWECEIKMGANEKIELLKQYLQGE